MYLKHMRKILCQALETQGKDNQKNWLSLCVFLFVEIFKDRNVVHRWQIFFRLLAGKRGNMYYDIKESGKRIKELRKKAGITQEELANKLNISTVAISNMERGVNGVSLDMMGILAEVLNSSVDYIAFGKKTLVLDMDLPEEKLVAIMEFVKVMMG